MNKDRPLLYRVDEIPKLVSSASTKFLLWLNPMKLLYIFVPIVLVLLYFFPSIYYSIATLSFLPAIGSFFSSLSWLISYPFHPIYDAQPGTPEQKRAETVLIIIVVSVVMAVLYTITMIFVERKQDEIIARSKGRE